MHILRGVRQQQDEPGRFSICSRQAAVVLPWRPIIDRQLGREVMGIVQGGSVSWQLGRQRGLER
ncbi:DUF3363 domain-containing protein [Escherichia coli]|nr:DUF3363 domain-containing protein [Salmonella enterica]MCR6041787.1 DUF3363 domain-containing protein [Salmonella enterica subsp. enterica]NIZ67852.1 DUF3363 domain-containing protein [Escherichia coli]NMG82433.1 DUF3363 domain-containing protein [Salmonella enterica subsp. enterica serovar Typhimurium]HAE5263128.1 DUF3363 domain-containing protein [Salmonella enterica subsp. enterica serovar Derby]